MKRFKIRGVPAVLLALFTALLAAAGMTTPALANSAPPTLPVVHVATSGHNSPSCGYRHNPCRTIQKGVDRVQPGGTVLVAHGTYHEGVLVYKTANLVGFGYPVINARGHNNGIAVGYAIPNGPPPAQLPPPRAVGSKVSGFKVVGATGEGILALMSAHLALVHNVVTHNDLGAFDPHPQYAECQGQGEIPGDCGEGIHIMSTPYTVVAGNRVTGNVGGVLVTDEVGPSHDVLIARNDASYNRLDCGITVPSHSVTAWANGHATPATGGVFRVWVVHNRVVGNGGAGVLFAAPAPGSASYDNVVVGNWIAGNGLAGVTLHNHAPKAFVGNIKVEHNYIGRNNIGKGGDPDAGDPRTTGIVAASDVVPITGLHIRHNLFKDNHFGVFLKNAPASPRRIRQTNHFVNVAVPVHVAPAA
jgi:hypothetical protein